MQRRIIWTVVLGMSGLLGAAPVWAAKKKTAPKEAVPAQATSAPQPPTQAKAGRVKIDPVVIDAIETLSATDPQIALRVYYLAAEAAQAQQQPERAQAIYEAAVNAAPKDEGALSRLLGVSQQQGQHDQVIAVGRRLTALRPEALSYTQAVANAQFAKGNVEAGLATWEQAVTSKPDDAAVRLQFANVLQGQGKREDALAQFEAAAKLKPQDLGVLQQLGQAYVANLKPDRANEVYERILATAKEPWIQRDAGRQLLVIAQQQQTLEPMLTGLEGTVAKAPDNLTAHWQLIDGYAMSHQPDKLLTAAERAVKRFPEDQELSWRLVNAYRQQRNWDGVITVLKRMVDQNPTDRALRSQLAQAYADAGRPKEAVAVLDASGQADPTDPTHQEQIAELYVRANQVDEAIRRYEVLLAKATEEGRKTIYASRLEQLKQQLPPSAPAPLEMRTSLTGPAAPSTPAEPAKPSKKKRR